jgi:hypothetical protein
VSGWWGRPAVSSVAIGEVVSTEDEELKSACFELARTTKWPQKPIDAQLLTSLAEKLEEIAEVF